MAGTRRKPPAKKKAKKGVANPLFSKVRFIVALVLLGSCPVLMFAFSVWGAWFFPAYRIFSKALASALAAIDGWVPIAVWDWLSVYLAAMAGWTLLYRLWKRMPLRRWASWTLLIFAAIVALAVDGWALDHYAPTLASEIGLTLEDASEDDLAAATSWYLGQAASLAQDVPRTGDGSLKAQDFFELAPLAGASYTGLAERYPVFEGSSAPVKALILFGKPLLYSGHNGIYWAPTGEACVPLDAATADMPFTMCHEAAHRLGIAREEDANFAAYLACASMEDVRFRYAGNYQAFVYCLDALYAQDPRRAQAAVQEALHQNEDGVSRVFADIKATEEHYAAFKGAFEEAGSAVNDAYLKSFGEEEGIRSYGVVVDALVAWHKQGA